ncbi:MAG: hypothetical protein U0R78_13755 [Nocardioidaceae bacterium]
MSTAQATEVVQALGEALSAGDAQRAAALAADPAVAERLATMARNAGRLRLRGVTATTTAPPGPDGALTALVTWQVPVIDPDPLSTSLTLRLVTHGDATQVAAVQPQGQTPLWLQAGPVVVRRAGAAMVVLAAHNAGLGGDITRETRRAVATVRAVLPHWSGRLALEVAADTDSYEAVLDASPGERAGDAAVTVTLGDPATSRSSRVVINPAVFSSLRPIGRRVVLAHEATHVATSAAASPAPLWLVEGFADYVALRDVAVPEWVSAAQLLDEVRRHGPPTQLPSDTDFQAAGDRLAAAYEASWLACLTLAEAGGERALVRFYREVDGDDRAGRWLRREFGWRFHTLVSRVARRLSAWRA